MLYTQFGVSGSYYAPGASAVTTAGLTLLVNLQPPGLQVYEPEQEIAEHNATISVMQSALTSPALDGLFLVGSDYWRIHEPPLLDNGMWSCACRHSELESIGKRVRSGGR